MTTIDPSLKDAIQDAWSREEWARCAELCEKALAQTTDAQELFRLKKRLAFAASVDANARGLHAERAVELYRELLQQVSSDDPQWAALHRNLGSVYSDTAMRNEAERDRYLRLTADHYERALTGVIADTVMRANIAAQAAYALMYLDSGDREAQRSRALELLNAAHAVFSDDEYAEELAEVERALATLRAMSRNVSP